MDRPRPTPAGFGMDRILGWKAPMTPSAPLAGSSPRHALGGSPFRSAVVGMLILLLLSTATRAEEETPYLLGPLDRLRLTVAEWLPEQGTTRDWSVVNGDYTVDASGHIAVPFVGSVPAAGRTAEDVARAVGPALSRRLGLLGEPFATAQIVAYRPLFVTGRVRAPGQYEFLPGLTVAQALAMAGGFDMGAGGEAAVDERALINATGALAEIETNKAELLAEEARLRAEIAGNAAIDFPPQVEDADGAAEMMAAEATILRTREERLVRRIANLEQLKELLRSELISLEEKIVSQRRQADLAREEAAGLARLAERGLTRDSQLRAIERTVADAESGILTIETEMLRVRQDLNRADRDMLAARSDREAELATELRAVSAQLRLLDNRAELHRRLAANARMAGAAFAGTSLAPEPEYSILRVSGTGTERIAAGPETRLQPGDVLELTVAGPLMQ